LLAALKVLLRLLGLLRCLRGLRSLGEQLRLRRGYLRFAGLQRRLRRTDLRRQPDHVRMIRR